MPSMDNSVYPMIINKGCENKTSIINHNQRLKSNRFDGSHSGTLFRSAFNDIFHNHPSFLDKKGISG